MIIQGGFEGQVVQLGQVADINEGQARSVAAQFGCAPYTDYRLMLERERVEALSVCTPPVTHAGMALHALSQGVHVLCEKPLTIHVADAKALVQAAHREQRVLMMASKFRFVDDIIKDQGTVVAPGPGSEVFRVVNLSNMYIEVLVPETYIASIVPGKVAKVHFPILNSTVESKVKETGNYINPNNRSFSVKVPVPSKENIKPNLTANVRINDYYQKYDQNVRNLSVDDIRKVSNDVVQPEKVNWFMVGDRAEIIDKLDALGFDNRRSHAQIGR